MGQLRRQNELLNNLFHRLRENLGHKLPVNIWRNISRRRRIRAKDQEGTASRVDRTDKEIYMRRSTSCNAEVLDGVDVLLYPHGCTF